MVRHPGMPNFPDGVPKAIPFYKNTLFILSKIDDGIGVERSDRTDSSRCPRPRRDPQAEPSTIDAKLLPVTT